MSEFFIFIFIALLRGAYPWMGCGRTGLCHSCLGEGLRKFLVFFAPLWGTYPWMGFLRKFFLLPLCRGRIPGWDLFPHFVVSLM